MQEIALLGLEHSLRTEIIFQEGSLQTSGKTRDKEIRELNSPVLDSKIRTTIDMYKIDIRMTLKPELETIPELRIDLTQLVNTQIHTPQNMNRRLIQGKNTKMSIQLNIKINTKMIIEGTI